MVERLKIGLLMLLVAAIAASSAAAAGSWSWPVSGDVITPYKNGSDPYAAGQHRGIDIASPVGSAVHASVGGNVTYAGHLPDGGITATVKSGDGRYLVSYLHMSQVDVKKGDSVSEGQTLGSVGTTGKRSATQPHLHLSVRLVSSGEYIDPLPMMGPRPATQTPAADAPAVAQPVENAAPQAKSKAHARGRVHARTPEHKLTRQRVPKHATSRGTKPNIVHVPASGDSVSAHSHRAADSARESHASQSRGRVAPPPLPLAQPSAVNLATPGHTALTVDDAQAGASSAQPDRPPWTLAAVLLAIAGIGAFALRRRRTTGSDFTPPLAHRQDLQSQTPEPEAEVVEIRAAGSRR